jgi:hypothetical protein
MTPVDFDIFHFIGAAFVAVMALLGGMFALDAVFKHPITDLFRRKQHRQFEVRKKYHAKEIRPAVREMSRRGNLPSS